MRNLFFKTRIAFSQNEQIKRKKPFPPPISTERERLYARIYPDIFKIIITSYNIIDDR